MPSVSLWMFHYNSIQTVTTDTHFHNNKGNAWYDVIDHIIGWNLNIQNTFQCTIYLNDIHLCMNWIVIYSLQFDACDIYCFVHFISAFYCNYMYILLMIIQHYFDLRDLDLHGLDFHDLDLHDVHSDNLKYTLIWCKISI